MDNQIKRSFERFTNEIIENEKSSINELGEEILSMDKEEYLGKVREAYTFNELKLDINKRKIDIRSNPVLGQYFPPSYDVDSHKTYNKDFFIVEIPITGEDSHIEIANFLPSKLNSISINNNLLYIGICSFVNDLKNNKGVQDEINIEVKKNIKMIESELEELNVQREEFKIKLPNIVEEFFNNQEKEIRQKKSALDNLDPFK